MTSARTLWPRSGLYRHPDFLRLWAAQAVSAVGTRVTRTALPVIAVLSLSGSPTEVAVLACLSFGPGVLVGLFCGGWVDRSPKRGILVAADVVRALAVASLPVAFAFGTVHVAHVYLVAVVVGAATSVFQVADVALLPRLVPPERLLEGNSKIAATEAFAEVTGPALGGALIQWLGAPLAVLLDAASYLWSATFLRSLRPDEVVEARARVPVLRDAALGMRTSFGHPVVGPLFVATGLTMFCGGAFAALYMLYTLRTLGLSTAAVGAIIGAGGLGALIGSLLARRLPALLGLGRTLVLSLLMSQLASLLIPLAGMPFVPRGPAVALLVTHQLVGDAFFMSFVILATTLRQSLLPADRLGRVNATLQLVTGALLPLGALAAGPLAARIGVRETLWLGTSLGLVGPALLAMSRAAQVTVPEEPAPDPSSRASTSDRPG